MPTSKSEGSLFIPEYGDIKDPGVRAKYGYLEAAVSIIGNFLLFILKLFLGMFINSIALVADAFHTLSDVGTSGVVIFGFRLAKKPPDKEHPFGHGRVEYVATMVIAILLVIVGFEFIRQSAERIIHMEYLSNDEFALIIGIVICVSAVVKELMAQFGIAIGRKIDSDILIADAWHHRSDAIASVAVGLSIIGSSYGYQILDPVFGIIVSFIIIWVGIDLMRRSGNTLIGAAPKEELLEKIRETVKPIKEAINIDKIFVHDYGPNKIVSLHLNVEKRLSIEEAHRIADRIEDIIKEKLGFLSIIHLEPEDGSENEKLTTIIVEDILKSQDEIISFHKIQINRRGKKEEIKMHIVVDENMPIKASHDLHHRLEVVIKEKCGDCDLDLHIEPASNDCKFCEEPCGDRKD
jgi:cation diffusion facilitator family transporter